MNEMLERYNLEIVNDDGGGYIRCEPVPDGSWVMFRDVAALQARVAELEEALRPFANVGEFIAKHHPDPETDQNHETATLVRHFRNAYIALTGGKDE